MASLRLHPRSGPGSWLATGVATGLVGGFTFLVYRMIAFGIGGDGDGFLTPIRFTAAMVYGPRALDSDFELGVALVAALVVHFAISGFVGLVMAGVQAAIRPLRNSRAGLVLASTALGFVTWLVALHVVAPVVFPWWLRADPFHEMIGHTFLYGAVVGLLLAARLTPSPLPGRLRAAPVR